MNGVYSADGAELGVFGFEGLVKFLIFKVGELKFIALHFGNAHVAVLLFIRVDIVKFASGAFNISDH